jgi:hypothetical protein
VELSNRGRGRPSSQQTAITAAIAAPERAWGMTVRGFG